MLHHNIQTKIVEYLAANPGSSYAEIRPDNVESNAFSYHLKLLIKEGLVKKRSDGRYRLTAVGGMISHKPDKNMRDRVSRAYSVMFLTAQDERGRWLVRRRLYPPLHGYLETVLSHPYNEDSLEVTAKASFKDHTGMTADFEVAGNLLVRVVAEDELLSYKNVIVLRAKSLSGSLSAKAKDEGCQWVTAADIQDTEKVAPHMDDLLKLLDKGQLFWNELRYDIPSDDA